MKKALIASTALALTAGAAAADVTISGYGRTGVVYYENDSDLRETQVESRLRMNLDATTETENGLTFGGRLRLQHDQNGSRQSLWRDLDGGGDVDSSEFFHDGRDELRTQAGKLWVSTQGFTVEVGNVDTAMDSAKLIYATDLGSYDKSGAFNTQVALSTFAGGYFAYTDTYRSANRVGIAARYSIDSLTVRASYIDPDQSDIDPVIADDMDEKEFGLSADYVWEDRLELSASYTSNPGGMDGDLFFVGARYAVVENARIGLNYGNADDFVPAVSGNTEAFGQTIALYGDYTLADGLTNIEAYVSNNDGDWATKETDTAFGIGLNYDLGGARLGASIQRDYREYVYADMGVRFDF